MNNKFISFIILCTTLGISKIYAQGQLCINQYLDAIQYYNPSAIGLDTKLHIKAINNRQLIGTQESSDSYTVLVNMPIKIMNKINGLGVEVNTNKFGRNNRSTEISTSYSWIQNFNNIHINIGGGIVFRNSNFDNYDEYIVDKSVPDLANKSNTTSNKFTSKGVDLNIGLFIKAYDAFISISSRNLLNTKIIPSEKNLSFPTMRYYNLILGYNYTIPKYKIGFTPSLLFSLNDNLHNRTDISLSTSYNDMALDISYRHKSSFGIGISSIFSNVKLGYRLDIPTNKYLRKSSWGTHEFFVSYAIDIISTKNIKNNKKSIRIL